MNLMGRVDERQIHIGIAMLPRRDNARDTRRGEDELGVSQDAQPHPQLGGGQVCQACRGETKMLFQKAEGVFDDETPQIHAAHIHQWNILWAGPEQH